MHMTTDAKRALSASIRSMRARLLDDLHASTETAYRLSVRARDAGLDEAARVRRDRLETWVAEQLRTQGAGEANGRRTAEDFRREAEKQAAYTLLNRLVLLRLMEAPSPSREPIRVPAVITGGWESPAYKDFRQLAPELVRGDATEGYAFLLQLIFQDLATELPGLYGAGDVAELVPVPAATLRHVVDALNASDLDSCWTDDMTLGWVYQYWNDPEREVIDAKLNGGGKVEPYEIASKTQMFTERYMVDWLLQNSLGPMWLAMCKKHGWTPEVEANGTLAALEARRAEFREKREAGETELTALMALRNDAERRWAYYIPQPIPDEVVTRAPDSIRDLKLIDPAVGSGHFLVVALDLLVALYREEARHRGESVDQRWADRAIVERILGHNLHGIDLDPRAVQIAAAALWLKAQHVAPDARPERINLVASSLRLARLPDDDPAIKELRLEVERDTGIPGTLTDTLVHALRGADQLGSLLKIDRAVDEALSQREAELSRVVPTQGDIFTGFADKAERKAIDRDEARATLLDRIEGFLSEHTRGDDLGLRLRGEQLAAGVRFVRMVREGTYDLVVANPPYQGTAKMADARYVEKVYPLGKADLYAAFLLRGLELVREGGFAAQVSMNGWMFVKQYAGLRKLVLNEHSVRSVADLLWCAFEQMRHNTVAMYCLQRGPAQGALSVGLVPTPRHEREESIPALERKRAAILCQVGHQIFASSDLKVVPEWPLVFWWDKELLAKAASGELIGKLGDLPIGLQTGNNDRFLRRPWEVPGRLIDTNRDFLPCEDDARPWKGYAKGAAGIRWFEPLSYLIWFPKPQHPAYDTLPSARYGQGAAHYFREGVAYNTKGAEFSARALRFASVFDVEGRSLFGVGRADALSLLNSPLARYVAESLNPTIHFTAGDVARIPFARLEGAEQIFSILEEAFARHESHREPSVEFKQPGPSSWRSTQDWAQRAVDRPDSTPLPNYIETLDPELPSDQLSFALGVALGRFDPDGGGILDPANADLSHALPHGILFLDTTLDATDNRDGLGHPATAHLHAAWAEHGSAVGTKRGLREWLAMDFFKEVHKGMYENRPIHWPLTSTDKTFVALVNVHRFDQQTLRVLLADHLMPTLARLDGELNDLRDARDGANKKAARAAEKQFDRVLKAKDELQAFAADVEQCADRGAPPTDVKCPTREVDARYAPTLDDGVMINSAALWPLLDPQWKSPKKWWKELATAMGRKDYDWSHLAMRYWPTRVDRKCQEAPSLSVAHGCFWRYHPEHAWAWELRLQQEVSPLFRLEEAPYRPGGRDIGDAGDRPHREAWLRDHAGRALIAIEREAIRRMGRGNSRTLVPEIRILETGLWSGHAADIWEMELRLSEKQGSELRVLAPDERDGRAAFMVKHPKKVTERQSFLENLVPSQDLFEDDKEDACEYDDDSLGIVEDSEELEP